MALHDVDHAVAHRQLDARADFQQVGIVDVEVVEADRGFLQPEAGRDLGDGVARLDDVGERGRQHRGGPNADVGADLRLRFVGGGERDGALLGGDGLLDCRLIHARLLCHGGACPIAGSAGGRRGRALRRAARGGGRRRDGRSGGGRRGCSSRGGQRGRLVGAGEEEGGDRDNAGEQQRRQRDQSGRPGRGAARGRGRKLPAAKRRPEAVALLGASGHHCSARIMSVSSRLSRLSHILPQSCEVLRKRGKMTSNQIMSPAGLPLDMQRDGVRAMVKALRGGVARGTADAQAQHPPRLRSPASRLGRRPSGRAGHRRRPR